MGRGEAHAVAPQAGGSLCAGVSAMAILEMV